MSLTHRVERVVLHAGLPKTATTSIQNACFAQRKLLLDELGLLYPGDQPNHTDALCTAFHDDPRLHITHKVAGITDLDRLRRMGRDIVAGFENEIEAAQPRTVMFSAEGLSNRNADELSRLNHWIGGFSRNLSVLYVLRDPVSYVESVIQQHLKGGETLGDLYADPPMPNIRGRLEQAVEAFGRERIRATAFDRMCRHPEGVLGGFLDLAQVPQGAARAAIVAGQRRDNESLSQEAALLLDSINRQRPAFVGGERGPERSFEEVMALTAVGGGKFTLPGDVCARVEAACRDDLDWLHETFGLDLTPLAPHDRDRTGQQDARQFSQDALDTLALVLSDQINEIYASRLIDKARKQAQLGRSREVQELAAELRRVAPKQEVPQFMSQERKSLGTFGKVGRSLASITRNTRAQRRR